MKKGDKKMEHINMTETYKSFARIWTMFNTLKKARFTDEAWAACVAEADEIGVNNSSFIQHVICEVITEAERESKMPPEERKNAYKAAAEAFNGAWTLLKTLIECDDREFSGAGIRLLEAYEKKNGSTSFAVKMGTEVYKTACIEKNSTGSFFAEAMDFYDKYSGGISSVNETAAAVDAEKLLNRHPEYTLHVMEMVSGLKRLMGKAA